MSATVSLAKAGALASTAFLMGAYVWFQAKGQGPEVLADTTTGQVVSRPVRSQPETLPGPKSAPADLTSLVDMIDGNPDVLPRSKDAPIFTPGPVVFPGSKSDGVFAPQQLEERVQGILPGSKSSMVQIIPQNGGKQDRSRPPKPAAPPAILSGSKSKAPLIPSPKKKDPLSVLPGSKVRVPLVPAPAPTTKPGEKENKPAVLPGSKSISGILDRETLERALERTRKNEQKQAPVEEQKRK